MLCSAWFDVVSFARWRHRLQHIKCFTYLLRSVLSTTNQSERRDASLPPVCFDNKRACPQNKSFIKVSELVLQIAKYLYQDVHDYTLVFR